jgi:hypothetical protein
LTHEAAELGRDRVLGSIPTEGEARYGNYDKQDRGDGRYRIEGNCRAPAQRFVVDERLNGVLYMFLDFRKSAHGSSSQNAANESLAFR